MKKVETQILSIVRFYVMFYHNIHKIFLFFFIEMYKMHIHII